MKTVVAILLVCIIALVAASDSDFATKLANAVQAKLKTKLQKLKKAKRPAFRRTRKHKFAIRILRTLARLGGKLRRWSGVVRRLTRSIAIHLLHNALRRHAKKSKMASKKAKKPSKYSTKSDFFFIPAIIAAAAASAAATAAAKAVALAAVSGAVGGAVKAGIDAAQKKDSIESDFFPALVPAAVFAGKALAGGALGAAGAHAYDKFIRRRDMSESDAEFLGKLVGKVKGVVSKGVSIYNKAKPFIGIAKNFIDTEEESDMTMLPRDKLDKLKQLIKSKNAEKKFDKSDMNSLEIFIPHLLSMTEGDSNIDKCQVCKAGCTLIKDESKRNLCIQACETFACKKD